MIIHPSQRGLATAHAEELSQLAEKLKAKGKSIIKLNVGQPITGAPEKALDAINLKNGPDLGYSPASGIAPLRQRIALYYKEKYQVTIDPERILITTGGSGGFQLLLLGCFDAGSNIAVPLPCYYSYLSSISIMGLNKVMFNPLLANNYQPTVLDIENLKQKVHGLLVNSPANPTGSMIRPQQFKELIDYCTANNILLISDEIYHGIVYDKSVPEVSALNYSDNVVVVNSFSKYFSMPGWRLGWIVVPESMIVPMRKLSRNLFIAAPTLSQYVALACFDCQDVLESYIDHYVTNRTIFLSEMPKAGFDNFPPLDGAFYLYAHVKNLTDDSLEFCKKMVNETGVLASPGTDYDPINGHHCVRFSYAGSTAEIKEAVARLIKWRS